MAESKIETLARLNGLLAEARTLAEALEVPEPEPEPPEPEPEPAPKPQFNGDPFNLRSRVTEAMIALLAKRCGNEDGRLSYIINELLSIPQVNIVYGGDAIVVTIPSYMRGNDVEPE